MRTTKRGRWVGFGATVAVFALVLGCSGKSVKPDSRKIASDYFIPDLPANETIDGTYPDAQSAARRFLLTQNIETNAAAMEKKSLMKFELPLRSTYNPDGSIKEKGRPYSGPYWADRYGNVGVRYQDNTLPDNLLVPGPDASYRKWQRKFTQLEKKVDDLTDEEIARLSPAEKYDILVGDKDFTFTKQIWARVEDISHKVGVVPIWSGICNGWAPSSILFDRPQHKIKVPAYNGRQNVTFYPDDVKALTAILYANSFLCDTHGYNSKGCAQSYYDNNQPEDIPFYGNACSVKRPKRDRHGFVGPQNSYRFDENECGDPNAGVVHMALVNRLGVQKRSLVIDKAENVTVSNHPVAGYEYVYYNPKTGKEGTYAESVVQLKDYPNDPFKEHRNARTQAVVGVKMKIKVFLNTWAKARDVEVPGDREEGGDDKVTDAKMKYDLELDSNGDIVSGQWRFNRKAKGAIEAQLHRAHHPDFMWYIRDDVRVWSMADAPPGDEWTDASKPVPSSWLARAQQGAKTQWILADADRLRYPEARAYVGKLMKENPKMSLEDAQKAAIPELDKLGVPKGIPYAQPLTKIVHTLNDAAATPSSK